MSETKFERIVPGGEGETDRRLRLLEADLRAIRSAKRLEAATIGAGGLTVTGGGNVDVTGTGKVTVWGPSSVGVLENGAFGVITLNGEQLTYPSTHAQPNGFLVDAGPSIGYAAYVVDAQTGAAVVSSSVNRTMLAHATTGDVANARLELNGEILRVTSSRRYKADVADLEIDPAAVLAMRARTWVDKDRAGDPDAPQRVGFIAEELHDLGLGEFVEYDDQGRPDAIKYDRLSAALLTALKSQAARLDALESRLDALGA